MPQTQQTTQQTTQPTTPQTLAILGARGDLAGRLLLPALVRLAAAGGLPADTTVLAVDREPGGDEDYRTHVRDRLAAHLPADGVAELAGAAEELVGRMRYRQADVTDPDAVRAALRDATDPLAVYLALPNGLFGRVVDALSEAELAEGTVLVVEKPFGSDLADAKALNHAIGATFPEQHVFRVDHFLAKQTALDVLGMRFANRIFEPVWNREHIAHVDIIWDEALGLEGRAGYYDRAGALRDMVQNHLLQLLALVAMEPPPSVSERDLRDRKADVLRCVEPPRPDQLAARSRRARYTAGRIGDRELPDYVVEDGVEADRHTETWAELTVTVENWRWAGVPFRLRTGKALAGERREIAVHFRSVPHQPFHDQGRPAVLRFSLNPDSLSLELNLNGAGDPFDLERATLSADFPNQELPPYALLMQEILAGDATLSVSASEAEEGWRIVAPVLAAWADGTVPLEEYPAGSHGPPSH